MSDLVGIRFPTPVTKRLTILYGNKKLKAIFWGSNQRLAACNSYILTIKPQRLTSFFWHFSAHYMHGYLRLVLADLRAKVVWGSNSCLGFTTIRHENLSYAKIPHLYNVISSEEDVLSFQIYS